MCVCVYVCIHYIYLKPQLVKTVSKAHIGLLKLYWVS